DDRRARGLHGLVDGLDVVSIQLASVGRVAIRAESRRTSGGGSNSRRVLLVGHPLDEVPRGILVLRVLGDAQAPQPVTGVRLSIPTRDGRQDRIADLAGDLCLRRGSNVWAEH